MVGVKRGRKSKNTEKQDIEENNNNINNNHPDNNDNSNNIDNDISEINIPKKRGRKPKGGKIIETNNISEEVEVTLPNVIVHFKCKIDNLLENTDLDNYVNDFSKYALVDINIISNKETKLSSNIKYKKTNDQVIPNDAMDYVKGNDLGYAYVDDTTTLEMADETNSTPHTENNINTSYLNVINHIHNHTTTYSENNIKSHDESESIEVNNKIREMEVNFHNNDLNGKRSACFWDTCPFDTPAFYIPKSIDNDNVRPYGCFCSLNCALAYLHNEEIDASTKFERRQLLFNLYSEVIGNKTFIKPSPNPRYTLDKYYGNLSIQQWRSLLAGDRMLLIVDKPLTPELPELHTETIDRFMTMGSVNNNTEVAQYGKFKIRKAAPKQSKGAIVAEKFGIIGK